MNRINEHILTNKVSTHIREGFEGWQAGFTVQQQTFYLQPVSSEKGDEEDTEEKAKWYQQCLETALNKIQQQYDNVKKLEKLREDNRQELLNFVMIVANGQKGETKGDFIVRIRKIANKLLLTSPA